MPLSQEQLPARWQQSVWMKRSQQSHMGYPKLQQSREADEAAVEVVVEAADIVVTVVADSPEVAVSLMVEISPVVTVNPINPNIEGQSILTFRKASGVGAPCISVSGARLIFVTNPGPVHGRTSSLPRLIIEVLTSSM